MKLLNILLMMLMCLQLGCIGKKSRIRTNVDGQKKIVKTAAATSVNSVSVINNQLKITGQNLSGVTSLKLHNNVLNETFTIESASANQIIANATQAVALRLGQTFDLILNTAEGAATYPVSFTIDNGSITANMLSTSGASSGDILKFNGTSWIKAPLISSQLYVGGWDAASDSPSLVGATLPTAGNYYIVTASGSQDLGNGTVTYAIGDMIISNGASWDLISGSGNVLNKTGGTMSGVLTLDSDLKIKSSSNTNYITIKAPALASSYNLTMPTTAGTAGYVLSTNGLGITSWVAQSVGNAGTVTSVTSANADITITPTTTTPVLTLNSGTSAGQIVKLNGSAQLPAVNGSLLTSLNPSNLSAAVPVSKGGTGITTGTLNTIAYFDSTTTMSSIAAGIADQVLRIPGAGGAPAFGAIDLSKSAAVTGALPITHGGTGATTLGAAQSALGITVGGATTGSAIIAGTGGVVASKVCSSDASGGGVSCVDLTSSFLASSISDESGSGALLFGTSPTISNPEIGGTLKIMGSTSGSVGLTAAAAAGSAVYTLPTALGTNGQVLTTNALGVLSWTTVSGGGGSGTVTGVTSANADIDVSQSSPAPVLTLNTGTGNNQIVKLNGSAQLPAVNGSLLTSLNPSNLSAAVGVSKGGTGLTAGVLNTIPYFDSTTTMSSIAAGTADQVLRVPGAGGAPAFGSIDLSKAAAVTGALPLGNGGTGATSASAARTALGLTAAASTATGSTSGTLPLVGTGGIVANSICSGDSGGGAISCATSTSSGLAGLISDETGTGSFVLATAPTFITSINAPLIIGGTGTTSTLIYKTTSGVGATGADHIFQVGNNGATEAMRILNNGRVGIGTSGPTTTLDVNGDTRVSGSLVATGSINGLSNVTLTTTATNAVESPEKMNIYYYNNHSTPATGVTYTLPTAVAGKQRCYSHYIGQTGVLTVATSAFGQYIIFRGAAGSSGGNATSAGALGDAACFVATSATHWVMYVNSGTWTAN